MHFLNHFICSKKKILKLKVSKLESQSFLFYLNLCLESLISGDPYKMVPSETIMQQINSMRLSGVRSPGDTGYVHNLQQANAIAEGGTFYTKKKYSLN